MRDLLGAPTYGDLEAPGALLGVARALSRRVGAHRELVMMFTGPDRTSVQMTNNSLITLARVGLRQHVLLIADSWTTCETLLAPPCFWSSRVLRNGAPSDSIVMRSFWNGWRFKFYAVKKLYFAALVRGGFSVLQADTDTVWVHDPFPMLRAMTGSSIVAMRDVGLANAGVIYARPGSAVAQRRILDEVAWRVQLFQNYPELVGRLVRFARPPYYSNSDDQTLLNDAIVSAVLSNRTHHVRTFLGSTARFEAKNRYNQKAPPWEQQPESKLSSKQIGRTWRAKRTRQAAVPWWNVSGGLVNTRCAASAARAALRALRPPAHADGSPPLRYNVFPLGQNDSVALAPRTLFAHLPFLPTSAITHLTAARGFANKVAALRKIGMWHPDGDLGFALRPKEPRPRPTRPGQSAPPADQEAGDGDAPEPGRRAAERSAPR